MPFLSFLERGLHSLATPWIVLGDFNSPPAAMAAWANCCGGVILRPKDHTCWSPSGGTTIDYAVASTIFAPTCRGCTVSLASTIAPHRPVVYEFSSDVRAQKVWASAGPRPFDVVAPLGPRAPPSPTWGSLAAAARAATTPEQVRVAWHGVLHKSSRN